MGTTTAPEIMTVAVRRQRPGVAVLWTFGGALALAFLLSVGWGAVTIAPGQVLAILIAPLGLELPWEFTRREEGILLAISPAAGVSWDACGRRPCCVGRGIARAVP